MYLATTQQAAHQFERVFAKQIGKNLLAASSAASSSRVTQSSFKEHHSASSSSTATRCCCCPCNRRSTSSAITIVNPISKRFASTSTSSYFYSASAPVLAKSGGDSCDFLTPAAPLNQFRRNMASGKVLTLDNMNPSIKVMEYAVRGPLVIRAGEIEKELKEGKKKPFDTVIRANIGDAHAMGQKPITFLRQVVAGVVNPASLNDPSTPADVKDRVNRILDGCKGRSAGSYSDSPGIEVIRRDVAEYIKNRDGGIPSNWDDIILCAGASEGIRGIMKLLNVVGPDGKKPGVMIPIPQYPLYTASIAEFDMAPISYYMDEDNNWGLDIAELKRAVNEARATCNPRAIVIINPGNPTGQVLTRQNIEDIIKFAHEERLFVFADEVYQDNVYDKDSKFHSFKKVMSEMGKPYSDMELASFLSTSKGYMGECGFRGGYAEVVNMDPGVKAMFNKSISAKLCPTVLGQVTMDVVVNPPKPGEPSYETFLKEKNAVLDSLAQRAQMISETFNSCPGIKCNPVQGAMYCFPQITIPPKAIAEAEKKGQKADFFYCMTLLERTGICIIPGSGFGQRPGTYHFRTTILPQPELLKSMLEKLKAFHIEFTKEWS